MNSLTASVLIHVHYIKNNSQEILQKLNSFLSEQFLWEHIFTSHFFNYSAKWTPFPSMLCFHCTALAGSPRGSRQCCADSVWTESGVWPSRAAETGRRPSERTHVSTPVHNPRHRDEQQLSWRWNRVRHSVLCDSVWMQRTRPFQRREMRSGPPGGQQIAGNQSAGLRTHTGAPLKLLIFKEHGDSDTSSVNLADKMLG